METYKYELLDRNKVLETTIADTLGTALKAFFVTDNYKVTHEFLHMAVVVDSKHVATSRNAFGIRWSPAN